eukprot:TRINITY_DN11120_c0_g1_i3.p1 TRINITY_DN11120_c0_g1~~TRINITY_DN11120_c0_g1_i3.p1  ORF type:complete len:511 (+),score=101.67 TRINITY_DN11120_c0_g1_i3:244-1776(+)
MRSREATMGLSVQVLSLLLLGSCQPVWTYIDTNTYTPVRLDTFSGAAHSITGERYFGFKRGGFIDFDMNCTGETGRLLLVAMTRRQRNDVLERPATVCNAAGTVAVAYNLEEQQYISTTNTGVRYQVKSEYGTGNRSDFYTFYLVECPPSAPVRSPPGRCGLRLVTLNPNGEHLSRDEIPLPDVYTFFILCWGSVLLAYILNGIWYWQYSNHLHKTLVLPALVGLILSLMDQAHWAVLSEDGVAKDSISDARNVFRILETTIFFAVTMALSDGWGIVHPEMDSGTLASVIGMPLCFFSISALTTFVHRYFLGLAIIMVVLIVVFVVRHSAGNLLFLHHRYHDIALVHRAENHGGLDMDHFAAPIIRKLEILSVLRTAFIFYCVTWAIVGIAASFMDDRTWIVELMFEILLFLYFCVLYGVLRLRDFDPFYEAERQRQRAENNEDDIEVELLADKQDKPFALLVPLSKDLFREFIKLQRRYADARAEQAVVDMNENGNQEQPGIQILAQDV